MTTRLIGSKQAAALLGMRRGTLNGLVRAGKAPGFVRKEPGGYGNRGQYLFDAEVIERIARERIAAIETAIVELLPPLLPLDEDESSASDDEDMRAAS